MYSNSQDLRAKGLYTQRVTQEGKSYDREEPDWLTHPMETRTGQFNGLMMEHTQTEHLLQDGLCCEQMISFELLKQCSQENDTQGNS